MPDYICRFFHKLNLIHLTVALLCIASLPTFHARPLQRSSKHTHVDGNNKNVPPNVPSTHDHKTSLITNPLQRSTYQTQLDGTNKKWLPQVPLSRDHADSIIPHPFPRSTSHAHLDKESNKKRPSHVRDHTSLIPHFRRRGLLPKYRRKTSSQSNSKLRRKLDLDNQRKSVTQSEWKRIMDSRKLRDDVINSILEDKETETGELEGLRLADARKLDVDTNGTNMTHSEWKGIIDPNEIRDDVLNAMLEDREIETEELDGVRPANASELIERATEMKEVFDYLNGSDGHIWSRKARWAEYDPNYDWENGGKDGGKDSMVGAKQESKLEKYAKSWQKHTLKFMFAFSFTCMLLCCCAACCKKVFGRLCEVCCWHIKEVRDIMLNRDPNYRRIRGFADEYGLQIDYAQYKKLKGKYESALSKREGRKVDLSGRN